ncbi:septal ring lytic transglycosylase RlpA family protein [Xanthobacter autotrophicus]|jgi:rare lipoprotein A|uniref:Endolytic peptidoglycan transglycosylase RlpA n=1 Tax=Xanthobacter autotrophicus TaxID=280 RepID=A0A6C1KHA1_XANAU|nr:septal ring lytic transglycosylase RlpA family protein [Xanthobacter autotrophicus]TLX43575.1 septal ring lytic transglycosylase RlpA family protein [Xanthobacter autotrophicus]
MKIRVVLSCFALSFSAGMAVSNTAKADTSTGIASYYWQGRSTASGERFNPSAMTAAHRSLPFGTKVRVTNLRNGRTVVVRINDRGPFIRGRVIDVSRAAASELGFTGSGVTRVALAVMD